MRARGVDVPDQLGVQLGGEGLAVVALDDQGGAAAVGGLAVDDDALERVGGRGDFGAAVPGECHGQAVQGGGAALGGHRHRGHQQQIVTTAALAQAHHGLIAAVSTGHHGELHVRLVEFGAELGAGLVAGGGHRGLDARGVEQDPGGALGLGQLDGGTGTGASAAGPAGAGIAAPKVANACCSWTTDGCG